MCFLNSYFLCGILLAIPTIYWYLTRNFNFWSKQGINGPRPLPIFGTYLYQFMTHKSQLSLKWHKKFGNIYGEYNGNTPLLIISEPQLVKQIFVKDFHIFPERNHNRTQHPILKKHLASVNIDDWKRIRSVLSPTFSSAKMKNVYPMINNCLKDFVNELDVLAIDGNEINMVTMYGQLTMDVISRCAFATKTNVYKDPNDPFVLNARKVFVTNVKRLILMLLLPKFVLNVMNVKHHAVESANQFFFNIIRQIIKERKNSHKKYNDLMDLLISAQNNAINNSGKHIKTDDENDVNEAHHLNEGEEEREVKRKTLMSAEKYLTEDEMLAQSWVFFAAGYETAATTLTFATYELALNPNCQQKLYEEVMEAVDSNGDIDYYLLSKLSYLDAVVSETLRLNPPAIQLERQAYEDYELPGTGLTLKKGQLLEFPIFAIHHNEEYYENAQSFIPERFLPQNRHNIKPYTYLPFGAGPRNCIGMRFGLMEAKLGLVQLIRRYRFVRSANTEVPLQMNLSTSFRTPKRMIVSIEKR